MRIAPLVVATIALTAGSTVALHAQAGPGTPPGSASQAAVPAADDPIRSLVGRLDLERYKATIKGLTQFGDRREGTARNRAAIDWIEARLKSYGCTSTERLQYVRPPTQPAQPTQQGPTGPQGQPAQPNQPGQPAPGAAAPAGGRGGAPGGTGGAKLRGPRARTGVNSDPNAQPDLRLRELNTPTSPPGPREEIYCTKVGTTRPDEMYIIGAHMDGLGLGEAANDDGSGTALVMELARILNAPDVQTERSIRFILWNNEETGLHGSRAYVDQRRDLQGREVPPGSGRYPEPRWLAMIQHDMLLFNHGMPRADGTVSGEQRPEADVNVEFQVNSKMAAPSQALAWALFTANEKYATDYPVSVGNHMFATDSTPFQDLIPTVSVPELERGAQIGSGWNPHWHQPTDLYATFSDKDFALGLNAAQTTLGALAQLAGARLAP